MRTTAFRPVDGQLELGICEVPRWSQADENGQIAAKVHDYPNFSTTFYRIPIGCKVPIHAGPHYTLCQIVSGQGKLALPDGKDLDYAAPELFIFEPGALHGWQGIVEETLLTVFEVKDLNWAL